MPSHAAYLERSLPLTAVALACSTRPALDALVPVISSFVDTGRRRWTIERACELGHIALLKRLVAHEPAGSTHICYRSHVFGRALVHAVRHGSTEMLECLHSYCPYGVATNGVEEAAAQGDVRVLDWLLAHCCNSIEWTPAFGDAAAHNGHLHVLKWLHSHSPDPSEQLRGAVKPAAATGRLEIVQWAIAHARLRSTGAILKADAFWGAAEGGHVAILTYLHSVCGFRLARPSPSTSSIASDDECYCDEDASVVYPIDDAAQSGSLETIEWLHDNGYRGFTTKAFAAAARGGHIEVMRWLLATAPSAKIGRGVVQDASMNGHFAILQLLDSVKSIAFSSNTLVDAATSGRLDIVQWIVPALIAADEPDDRYSERRSGFGYCVAMRYAAANGHFAIVQWLYEHLRRYVPEPDDVENDTYGSLEQYVAADEIDSMAVCEAASNGHDDIVTWLHARWPAPRRPRYYVHKVARRGDLVRVRWLVANSDVIVDKWAIQAAAESGNVDLLVFLSEFVDVREAAWAMRDAAANNHFDAVQWLAARGAPSYSALASAVKANHLRVAKWLFANVLPESLTLSTDVLSEAVSIEMVQWLLSVMPDGDVSKLLYSAAVRGDFDSLLLLYEVRGARCSADEAAKALENGHIDVFKWIIETLREDETKQTQDMDRSVKRLKTTLT